MLADDLLENCAAEHGILHSNLHIIISIIIINIIMLTVVTVAAAACSFHRHH